MKFKRLAYLAFLGAFALSVCGCKKPQPVVSVSEQTVVSTSDDLVLLEKPESNVSSVEIVTSNEPAVADEAPKEPVLSKAELAALSEAGKNPKAPKLTWLEDLDIPEWDGEYPYVTLNNNYPFFDLNDGSTETYEIYYALDELGRCTLAEAVVGPETQPVEKRGNISSVKPTGWHTDKYDFVDGENLYNRCHLIAYYLGAENANPNNLVTGTRYMNTDGMNDLENVVGDYIRDTGHHVRYRVTPKWTGDNLICDGLLVEAYGIEDQGSEICFCIYCYNVQPGVTIDYKNGDNYATNGKGQTYKDEGKTGHKDSKNDSKDYRTEEDTYGTYVLNTKTLKFHSPDCENIADISDYNKETYEGSRNALIDKGYVPCGGCRP